MNEDVLTQFRMYLTNEIQHNEELRSSEVSPLLRAATRGRIVALREALEEFDSLMAALASSEVTAS
ncbi:hypothetical protein N8J89_07970 [Crossiella sp. CA-258035]|uniref:hypothetical protein n=1 Tax=Crossiella sp. CA-258035 TaxID=2981138 RepID=UPI0024BC28CB|nr:hypothetical protein [Crossiella sp. CA-258035]WHT20991.1 hypothetical protein N8J89_07970 [Crossiella sp. CA-258035]